MATAKKLPKRKGNMRPLFDGAEWSFELINKVYDAMGDIACAGGCTPGPAGWRRASACAS